MASKEDAAPPTLFPWHARSKEACFEELGLSSEKDPLKHGLTTAEATARLERYGPNQLTEKKKISLLQRIWNQVNNVLVFILVVVAGVALSQAITTPDVTENCIQIGLILIVILVNVVLGIMQEGSAEKAADALKAMLSSDAVVIRDSQEVKIPAGELVPGDVVKLNLGDRVPADMRMLVVQNLAAGEAALTGESVPIFKTVDAIEVAGDPNQQPLGDRNNMCFSATLIAQGSGVGIVVSTGDNTEIGTINTLVNQVETKKSHMLEQIDKVSIYIAIFILIITVITWSVAFFTTPDTSWIEALSTALVGAVAMVPAGLASIVTITYAWAVSNMAKKNAIVRVLPSVEILGSVTVICSDKTGTLTKNEMSLVAFVTSDTRYKFDVDSKTRTPNNFVVNNSYLAARADHAKFLKASEVIKRGPSSSKASRRHMKTSSSFPFSITLGFGKTAHGGIEPVEPKPVIAAEGEHKGFEAESEGGASPDANFLRRALGGGILCSKCVLGEGGGKQGEIGNPTELAILRAAYFGGVSVSEVKDSAPIVAEVPFSSEYKFMATVHNPAPENDTEDYMDSLIVHVKGAPDRLIPLCKYQAKGGSFRLADIEPCDSMMWIEQIAILSSHGLRVLALTRGTVPKGSLKEGDQLGPDFVLERGGPWLTMVGLCAIMDPPRPECVEAIREAHGAGVRVAMITGDHRDTAVAIGGMLGLVDAKYSDAVTGPEMDAMNDEELRLAVQKHNVFARASPQNKIKIVKALQADGEVCSMTGDGVNDAPALKAADMGVAMGKEGTDVAREAAEMILADDNFATIIAAIREGRAVWDNLRKVLLINTPINNAQGMSVLFGLVCGLDSPPLTGIQVLYSNMICATTLGIVAAIEPPEDGIMEQPPRRLKKRLIGRFLLLRIALGTAILIYVVVQSVFWAKNNGYDQEEYQAQALNSLNFGALSVTASARFARKTALHTRSFHGNAMAWWSYALMTVLQVFITYTPGLNTTIFSMRPMDWAQWLVVGIGMVVVLVVMETEKAIAEILRSRYRVQDDEEYEADEIPSAPTPLPAEVNRFGLNEQEK